MLDSFSFLLETEQLGKAKTGRWIFPKFLHLEGALRLPGPEPATTHSLSGWQRPARLSPHWNTPTTSGPSGKPVSVLPTFCMALSSMWMWLGCSTLDTYITEKNVDISWASVSKYASEVQLLEAPMETVQIWSHLRVTCVVWQVLLKNI